jgi:hypothetical protein
MNKWQVYVSGKDGVIYRLVKDYDTREEAVEAWKEHWIDKRTSDDIGLEHICKYGMYRTTPPPTEEEADRTF